MIRCSPAWLCYHARHNDVYFDGRFISDSSVPPLAPFAMVPDLANVDFVATRDRLVDLKAPGVSCLTLVDDPPGEDRTDGHVRYWLGPPARLRFLALRANLSEPENAACARTRNNDFAHRLFPG